MPNGTVSYVVYKDADHEIRNYAWDASANPPISGPVSLSREDRARNYAETLTFTPGTYVWPTAPDGGEPIGQEKGVRNRCPHFWGGGPEVIWGGGPEVSSSDQSQSAGPSRRTCNLANPNPTNPKKSILL
jgi:hypothetical protein